MVFNKKIGLFRCAQIKSGLCLGVLFIIKLYAHIRSGLCLGVLFITKLYAQIKSGLCYAHIRSGLSSMFRCAPTSQ